MQGLVRINARIGNSSPPFTGTIGHAHSHYHNLHNPRIIDVNSKHGSNTATKNSERGRNESLDPQSLAYSLPIHGAVLDRSSFEEVLR